MGMFDFLFGKRSSSTSQQADSSRESKDAELVNGAIELINGRQLERAAKVLQAVLSRAPANYRHEEEKDGKLVVRFWEMGEFVAYVEWMHEQKSIREVVWINNAYPRAAYYLGYLAIEIGAFDDAIKFLDRGLQLQPTSAKLSHEKGQALLRLGRPRDALAVYELALARDVFVAPFDQAILLRGKGCALIDLGELDLAERSFQDSLKLDPESPTAQHELEYIASLRQQQG